MRHPKTWLIVTGLAITTGCSHEHRCHVARCYQQPEAAWYVESPSRPAPTLLFDRVQPPPAESGRYALTAQDFAFRDNWPSTPGYYSTGEAVFYREWYYDSQGDGYNNLDYLTRQFQSYRYGTKFR